MLSTTAFPIAWTVSLATTALTMPIAPLFDSARVMAVPEESMSDPDQSSRNLILANKLLGFVYGPMRFLFQPLFGMLPDLT